MYISNLGELRAFLAGLGIRPKKGLSQNFLVDGNILRKIVEISRLSPGEVVLEIGPGPGALTQLLLERDLTLIAVEKDRELAAALKRLDPNGEKLEIFNDDILEFPIEKILQARLLESQKAKVVANLPYHLTTPILERLVKLPGLFSTLTVMVQEEVARRFVAEPGSSDYSSFTLFLNYYTTPQIGFHVSRNCFYPAPKVDSAVVLLELKTPPKVSSEEKFFKLTRTAFGHRRKMMRSSLRELYPPEAVTEALKKLRLNPLARPEELSLNQFIQLFEEVNAKLPP